MINELLEKMYYIWLFFHVCIGTFIIGYGCGLLQDREKVGNKLRVFKIFSWVYCGISPIMVVLYYLIMF